MRAAPIFVFVFVFVFILASDAGWAKEPRTYYAVICNYAPSGPTPAAAMAACRREAHRGHVATARGCGCKNADVISVARDQKPALWRHDCWGGIGPTPERARSSCEQNRSEWLRKNRDRANAADDTCLCTAAPHPLYGPYARRHIPSDEFGDEKNFVYFDLDGSWRDENGDHPCLPTGTLVRTPDGEQPIETFAAGDLVLSWAGGPVASRVTVVKQRSTRQLFQLTFSDGRTLALTGNHPLFVAARGGWLAAQELRPGDLVTALGAGRQNLEELELVAVSSRSVEAAVYDLSIESTHAYFADGLWVHNY